MAIPVNELKYWMDGVPFGGVQGQENTDNILGELKYWDYGTPYSYIFPTTVSVPATPSTVRSYPTLLFMGVA